MKKVSLLILALSTAAFINAQDMNVYTDDFSVDHDYMADGAEGTMWKGMNVNTSLADEENNTVLEAFQAVDGALTITSENGNFGGAMCDAAYIYRMVPDGMDFEAQFKVVGGDFASFGATETFHNSVGVLARTTDYTVPNYVYAHLFELWGFHSILKTMATAEDGTESYVEVEVANGSLDIFPSLNDYPYIRLTRVGNLFTMATSPDNFVWTDVNSIERPDLEGLDLEVGIAQGNYTEGVKSAIVDDFMLTHAVPVSVKNAELNLFKVYSSNNSLAIESAAGKLIRSSKLFSIDGREIASRDNVMNSRVEFNNLRTGLYITLVNIDGVTKAQKVVVK